MNYEKDNVSKEKEGVSELKAEISTVQQEAVYVRGELMDKSIHYRKAGFKPVLPTEILRLAFQRGEQLEIDEIQQLLVPQEIRGERFRLGYERTEEALNAMGGH